LKPVISEKFVKIENHRTSRTKNNIIFATNIEELKTPENKKINFIEEYNSESCLNKVAKKSGLTPLQFASNERPESNLSNELNFTLNPTENGSIITRNRSYNNIGYKSKNKLPLINQNAILSNKNNKLSVKNIPPSLPNK